MKNIIQLLAFIGICLLSTCGAKSEINSHNYTLEYDLYIQGGTIVDGTDGEPFAGDLLAIGSQIVYIGKADATKIKVAKILDTNGKNIFRCLCETPKIFYTNVASISAMKLCAHGGINLSRFLLLISARSAWKTTIITRTGNGI